MNAVIDRKKDKGKVGEAEGLASGRSRSWGGQGVGAVIGTPLYLQRQTQPTLQGKLTISNPSYIYEREADRIADEVLRRSESVSRVRAQPSTSNIKRLCRDRHPEFHRQPPEQEDELLQANLASSHPLDVSVRRRHEPDMTAAELGDGAQRQVEGALRSCGDPLPEDMHADFEFRFGYDLGHVRVHSGGEAAAAAASMQARAFTLGDHVVWGGDQSAAFAGESRWLLAHEVTHTLQQGSGAGFSADVPGINQPRDPAEREVGRIGQAVSSSPRSAAGTDRNLSAPLAVSRQPPRIARVPSDKEINGIFPNRASFPHSVFFDRGSASLDPLEEAKLTAATTGVSVRFSGRNIELHGFRSEEETASLAMDRIQAVEAKLSSTHTGSGAGAARDPRPKPNDSSGQFNYREWRKVDIVLAGRPPPTGTCARVPMTEPCTGTDERDFQTLRGAAEWMAHSTAARLASPSTSTNDLLDTFFGAGMSGAGAAHATTIKDNFIKIGGAIKHTKGSTAHVCGTRCNPDCAESGAFNIGFGANALLTLCPFFFTSTSGLQIAIIIHESGHGSLGLKEAGGASRPKGLADFSYVAERLYPILPPDQAVINSDTYTWFAAALLKPPAFTGKGGGTSTPQPKASSDMLDPSIASSTEVRLAVGRAEKWLRWSQQGVASLYATAVTAMDKGSWTHRDVPDYGKPLMDRVAPTPRWDLTLSSSPPTMADRAAIAAIEDRFLAMVGRFDSTLTVKDGQPGTTTTAWSGKTLDLGTDFFALTSGSKDQALLVIRKLVEVTGGISSAVQSAYVDFADEAQKDVT